VADSTRRNGSVRACIEPLLPIDTSVRIVVIAVTSVLAATERANQE
jgi:hypothetical protein